MAATGTGAWNTTRRHMEKTAHVLRNVWRCQRMGHGISSPGSRIHRGVRRRSCAGRIFRRRMIRPFIRRKAAGNMTGRRVPFVWRGGRSACAGRNLQGCGDRRDPCKGRLGPAVHGRENPSLFEWKNSGPALSGLWRAARGYAGLCGGKRRALCREKGLCAVLCPQMRKVRAEL